MFSQARPSSPQTTGAPSLPEAAGWCAPVEWQDELILYGSGAGAFAVPLLTWMLASQNRPGGLLGVALAVIGIAVSARLSRCRLAVALPIGVILGALAASLWWAVAIRAASGEEAAVALFPADAALTMAQRMCALVLAISFWAVRPGIIAFALVPALTVFGLASGRLEGAIVGGLFCLFAGLALVILAWGVLFPDETATAARDARGTSGPGLHAQPPRAWRRNHLATAAGAFLLCAALGYGFSIPMTALSELYRWPLLMAMTPDGFDRIGVGLRLSAEFKRFPVGGPPRPLSETPMLSVLGPPAQYWRGSIYDQYTGSAWQRWQGAVPVAVDGDTVDLSRRFPPPPGTDLRVHTVRVEAEQPYLVHGPGQIVRAVVPVSRRAYWPLQADPMGALELPGASLTRGDTYEITTAPLDSLNERAAARLRSSERDRSPGDRQRSTPSLSATGGLAKSYLAVPLSAQRVAELAHRVAGKEPTSERKLEALVRYLQSNCVYSLEAPAVPRGEDAADFFLFRLRRGRCDLFATALAIMARAEGIPTRLATGYLEGVYDEESGAYLLRECDQHAWVEAYLPSPAAQASGADGSGTPAGSWVTVDPTAGAGEPGMQPRGWPLVWLRVRFFWQDHPWAILVLSVAALGGGLIGVVAMKRRRARAAALLGGPSREARAAVVELYARCLRILGKRFPPARRLSETPLEYLASLGGGADPGSSHGASPRRRWPEGLPPEILAPAAALTEVFTTARYGPAEVTPEQVSAARAALDSLQAALRRPRHLGAAQVPGGGAAGGA